MVKVVNICAARFPSVAWKALELPVRLTAFLENTAGSLLSFFFLSTALKTCACAAGKESVLFPVHDSRQQHQGLSTSLLIWNRLNMCWSVYDVRPGCVWVTVYELTDEALSGPGSIKASGSLAIKSKRKACLGSNEFQPSDPPICFHTELILSMSHPHMQTSNISFPAPPLHPLLSLPEFISHVSGLFY